MKKLRLKKWVVNVIVIISVLLFILLGAECENTMTFITSKISAIFLLYLNYKILDKFTDFIDKEF
jgi:Mg2+/citrate symporter